MSKKNQHREECQLQAVVIADSFNHRFAPISNTTPRALLPLVNIPLIDYTLEFLCSAGIQRVIVFCCIHADQIKAHLQSSKWTNATSPCEIQTIVSEDCLSVGDALRDIDGKDLIKSDFVLVTGDLISNMKLRDVLEEHKALREKEKNPIMTMVFKRALPGHHTRCREEDVILGVRVDNRRILHYQKVANAKKFDFPLAMFQEHCSVQLRYDLLDCHISICSPDVPMLFTENFDYQTRDDFVRGILVNEEILGNTIHMKVLESDYAARVSNLQTYDAISKDVMNRWPYPMVPDSNISNRADDQYRYERHNVYLHKDVTLARGCQLHDNVVVGMGTSVGQNTQIRQSVIGKNCTIGENVNLEGVYVWDNVTIEEECDVRTSVLCCGVHLLRNTTVHPKCVFSHDVKIGPDVEIPAGKILMSTPPVDSHGDPMEEFSEIHPELVGCEGVAYEYAAPPDSDEEGGEIQELWGISDDDSESSEGSDHDDRGSLPPSPPPDDAKMFYEEAISTLIRAEEENISKDNLVLEINSLKCAYYMQIHEVNAWMTKVLLEYPFRVNDDLPAAQYITQFKKVIKRFLPLLKNYIRSTESQKDCITAIEEHCLLNSTVATALPKILHHLYDKEILEEETVLRWFNNIPPSAEDQVERKELRKQVVPFIAWLKDAEEESSEED